MRKIITKLFLTLISIFGLTEVFATDICPFFLPRQDGTILEGYFSPPSASGAPIIFAIQGSSCESVLQWHESLSDRANVFGLGVITLEKMGVSRDEIDLFVYNQTDCFEKRLEDYALCFENIQNICPEWEGKPIFWGASEGGMLAAILAGQVPETTAILLFATGGGMQLREEVKWSLHQRLEKYGATQNEMDQYMIFLDEQMDAMAFDPTVEKQFLGKTYKWWASFLGAEKAVMSLDQPSLSICLVHGVKDSQVPVLSTDLVAENLAKTNVLTYLRLEGYGHDLDSAEVHEAACRWLSSILLGQEPLNNEFIVEMKISALAASQESQINLSEYIFSRGKKDKGESHGDVYGSARVDRDSDGREKGSVDVGVKHDFGNGWSAEVSGGLSGSKDKDGNAKAEIHGEARVNGRY